MFDWAFDKLIASFVGSPTKLPNEVLYVPPTHDRCSTLASKDVPPKDADATRIVVVSDTHGMHEYIGDLPESDVFVHCGDILMIGRFFSLKRQEVRLRRFNEWLATIPSAHKIVIGGNHDDILERMDSNTIKELFSNAVYLHNSECTVSGIKFWGSPASGMKRQSQNRAFQRRHFKTQVRANLPTSSVDVLLTHGHCDKLHEVIDHRVHLWGHSHHSHGVYFPQQGLHGQPVSKLSVCAALPGRNFILEHTPIVIDIKRRIEAIPDENDAAKLAATEGQINSHSLNLPTTVPLSIPVVAVASSALRPNNCVQSLKSFWLGHKIVPVSEELER